VAVKNLFESLVAHHQPVVLAEHPGLLLQDLVEFLTLLNMLPGIRVEHHLPERGEEVQPAGYQGVGGDEPRQRGPVEQSPQLFMLAARQREQVV
jgi:hypothetical protein